MKNYLLNKFSQYLDSIKFEDKTIIEVLKTKDPKFGDYTSNIAMRLTKKLNKPPMNIAEKIKKFIEKNNDGDFDKVTVTEPGFVNVFLSKKLLIERALKFIDDDYKPSFDYIKHKKINYEYVSANPTGDLHIGHARQATVGSIAVNALRYVGHEVFTEYYVNDAGVQMENLAKSVYYHYIKMKGAETQLTEESVTYNGKEIIEYARILAGLNIDIVGRTEAEKIQTIMELSCLHYLNEIKRLLKNELNIPEFDKWTSELELIRYELKEVVEKLRELDVIYRKDGATFLKTEMYGDEKDRVIIKRDGTHTYLLPDIANHLNKAKREFDLLVDLWGKDHHGYEARVQASMNALNVGGKLEVDFINMVHVMRGSEVVKMSKRAGTSLRIKDVISEVEPDVLKYSLVSKAMGQNMEIDIDEVLKEDLSNPYYYVQYSNARCNQIIEKYKEIHGGAITILDTFESLGSEESERELLSKMNEFEDVMVSIEKEREPSLLVNYQRELSQVFNTYYASCKVIAEDNELSMERINLILAIKNLFKTIFDILGIDAINKI